MIKVTITEFRSGIDIDMKLQPHLLKVSSYRLMALND